jgi:hypothetical protein
MLRIYKYSSPYEFQDFETHLFTTLRPTFDHANDRLYIGGQAYRISTINYIGLFNRLLDNQASYTITFGELDSTYAVLSNNANFALVLNPKLQGCILNLKFKKATANNLIISLPGNSYGKDIVNNTITLTGAINSTYILTAIYENGEYDWLIRSRNDGYGSSSLSWSEITEKPTEFNPAAHLHDERYSQLSHTHSQLHDQNTDVKIFNQGTPGISYNFGEINEQSISVKEVSLNFAGENKYIRTIYSANISELSTLQIEIYEGANLIYSQYPLNFSLVGYYFVATLNKAVKLKTGHNYTVKIKKPNNTAFDCRFYSPSTYYVEGVPYPPVSFTTDYKASNDSIVSGFNKSPICHMDGLTFFSQVETIGENVLVDATELILNGNLNILGDIFQTGNLYETHAQQLYTEKDLIILRENALAALAAGQFSGFKIIKYDGSNNLIFAVDLSGIARIGDESGTKQAIATREDSPLDGGFAKWEAATNKFITTTEIPVGSHTHSDKMNAMLAATTDFNQITVAGAYRMGSPLVNGGENMSAYGQLLVIRGALDTITQIYTNYNNVRTFIRSGSPAIIGGSGTWSSWMEISFTNHNHTGVYEPAFNKNSAFNKNFETNLSEIKAPGITSLGVSNNIARADHVHPSESTVKHDYLSIGTWNMDLNNLKTVAYSTSGKQILSIEAWIRGDSSSTQARPINYANWGYIYYNGTSIELYRADTPDWGFNAPAFSSTAFSRGYIVVHYIFT